MPFDTAYNRKISNENMDILKKYLQHQEEMMMSPFISSEVRNQDEELVKGGYGPRAPISEPLYEEVTVEQPIKKAGKGRPPGTKKSDVKKKKGGNLSVVVPSAGESFLSAQEKVNKIMLNGGTDKKIKDVKFKDVKKADVKKTVKNIDDILNAINGVKGEGMADLKKADVKKDVKKVDKKLSGGELLLREQMKGTRMIGGKKENKWLDHLSSFRKSHPEIKGKELMKAAKESYNK
jgi:hypothetical protein